MAKRFVTPLTDSEQQTLASAYHHREKRALRRRTYAILLSYQGRIINQISEILQVRRDSVSRWLKQWEASGLDGLIDNPRSGRTPILDERDQSGNDPAPYSVVANCRHSAASRSSPTSVRLWSFSRERGAQAPPG